MATLNHRPQIIAKPERKLDIINFKIHKVTPNGAMSGKSDARAQKRRQNLVQHWKFKPQNPAEIYISYPTGFSKLRRNSEPTIQNFVSHFKVDPKAAGGENSKPLSSLSAPSSSTSLQTLPKQGFFSYKLPKEPASSTTPTQTGSPSSPPAPASPPRATNMPAPAAPPQKSVMSLDCPSDLPSAAFLRRYSVPVVRYNTADAAMDAEDGKKDFPTQLAPFADCKPAQTLTSLPPLHDLLNSMQNTRIQENQGSPGTTQQTPQQAAPTAARTPSPTPVLVPAIKQSSSSHSQITTYEFPPRKPRVTFADTTSPTPSPTSTTDASVGMDIAPSSPPTERMSITTLVDPKKTKRSQSVPNILEPNLYNIPSSRMSVASLVQN